MMSRHVSIRTDFHFIASLLVSIYILSRIKPLTQHKPLTVITYILFQFPFSMLAKRTGLTIVSGPRTFLFLASIKRKLAKAEYSLHKTSSLQ